MALRATDEADISSSPLPEITYFWQDAEKNPGYEWQPWFQHFVVTVLPKHSSSITEFNRDVDEQHPRVQAMISNIDEASPGKKLLVCSTFQ